MMRRREWPSKKYRCPRKLFRIREEPVVTQQD
jgi:hypothetical protein